MKNIDKKAIKALDGLLTHIAVEPLARNIFSGKPIDDELEDIQVKLIFQGHGFIIDALKVIKAAKKKDEYKKLISDSNSDWADMI